MYNGRILWLCHKSASDLVLVGRTIFFRKKREHHKNFALKSILLPQWEKKTLCPFLLVEFAAFGNYTEKILQTENLNVISTRLQSFGLTKCLLHLKIIFPTMVVAQRCINWNIVARLQIDKIYEKSMENAKRVRQLRVPCTLLSLHCINDSINLNIELHRL